MFKKIQNVFKKRAEGVQGNSPNVPPNGRPNEFPSSSQVHQQQDSHISAHAPSFHYLPIEMGSASNARVEYPNMRDQKRSAIIDPVVTPGCPPGGICSDEGMRYPRSRRGGRDEMPADVKPPMKPANVRPAEVRPAEVREMRPAEVRPAEMREMRPAEVRHPRIPEKLPANTKYDQLPADSGYNQSPCDPYAKSPRTWIRQSPRERRPSMYQERGGTGGSQVPSDDCSDEPAMCKSEPNRVGRFARSKARPRVDADGRTDLQSSPTNRNLLDEVAEFYHQFPDLHTEVRIMVANNVTIYMLGTNHADPQCPIDVSNIVRRIRPQAVLIELCAWRACGCKDHVGNVFQTKPEFNFRYLRKVISQIGFLPAMIFFTDAFNEHNASVRGQLMDYGAEFAVAAQACKELTDCKIVLADREIPITVKRQASAMGNWRGLKMSVLVTLSLLFKGRMKKYLLRGHRLVIRDPHFYQIVVLERDIFLTYMIQAAASLPFKQQRPKIVAVVGQGHLNGIQSFWGKVVPQVLPLILKSDIDM